MRRWRVASSAARRRVAYENPWITVWHDEVDRPDGSPGIYGVVHFANLAAGVVALDDEDRIVLVGQHRYTLDGDSWEIPEGGVPARRDRPRRAPARAARGDRAEAADWRELGRLDLSNSVTDERAVLFLARTWRTATPRPTRPRRSTSAGCRSTRPWR